MIVQILNFVIGSSITEIHQYVLNKYVTPLFGVQKGDPRYDPKVDVNGDGVIDGYDIATFSKDSDLTFKTFGIIPILWWQVAVGGVAVLSIIAGYYWLKKRKR